MILSIDKLINSFEYAKIKSKGQTEMKTPFKSLKVIRDEKAKTLSYFCTEGLVTINKGVIDLLIQESKKRDYCNARICLHTSPSEDLHNMVILQSNRNYYRPHKHLDKCETYQIIKGEMAFFIFNEEGVVTKIEILSAEKNNLVRVGKNIWHVSIPLTEQVIFHESRNGPFLNGDSIFANWAPDGSDVQRSKEYFITLLEKID